MYYVSLSMLFSASLQSKAGCLHSGLERVVLGASVLSPGLHFLDLPLAWFVFTVQGSLVAYSVVSRPGLHF